MKLLFDARYTKTGNYHDGISRYSAELGNALYSILQQGDSLTFLISDDAQKKWFPKSAAFIKIHPGTSVKEPFTARILNKYHPDVVYSPMQTIGTVGRKYKSVLTLHDMIYYRHPKAPGFLPLPVRIGWWLYHQSYTPQRILLKGGDLITSISKTSAKDIKNARMTKRPVNIIYNAPQQFSTHAVQHEKEIKNIIYMGSFMAYKNTEVLIKGMGWLPGKTLHLLSRIDEKRQQELEKIVPKNATVIFHNGVSDDEYEQLLANNAALATASFDEGYGIPVAEAMAMGVPVVISDIPIFHEVGADGALYFDPRDPEDFAKKVRSLDNKSLRDSLVQKARIHINTFSWLRSAQILYDAMKKLI